jgi:carboxymethylenebutenolidase
MKVAEHKLAIPVGGGSAEAVLYTPEGGGASPGVLFLTDIIGMRPANLGMAKRVAEHGCTVLVPNIFHRVTKLPAFDFTPNFGEEKTMKRLGELRAGLNNEQMVQDGKTYVDYLLAQKSVKGPKLGVVGYCFTGAMAVRIAAAEPDKIAAAASFHGGGLYSDAPDSPHTLLPRIKARLYFGHAKDDRSMPAEAIAKFEDALKAWGGKYESETYPAGHGWTVPDHAGVHDEKQAEKHYDKLFGLFDATLK